jgi:hypothetical protein
MNFPINNTYDPEAEYLPYGESVFIRFIDVKPPIEEYDLDCDLYYDHFEQLEDIAENNEKDQEDSDGGVDSNKHSS